MKLTYRLAAVLVGVVLLVLALQAWWRLSHDLNAFEDDMRRDHRAMGRALGNAISEVWGARGAAEALDLLSRANEREAEILIEWAWLDELSGGTIGAWVERLAPLRAEAGGASTLAAILCYLLYVSPVPTDRVVRAADALPASMKEEIVTGAQQLIEQGRQEGLQKGRQEGRQEALAATLLRLAQRRFGEVPAETTARIEAAPAPDLERWLEGLLTAERLNDLFG